MTFMLLSAAHVGCTQYLYWNETYELGNSAIGCAAQSIINEDSVFISFGYHSSGVFARSTNQEGQIFNTSIFDLPYAFYIGHVGNKNESLLETDGTYILTESPIDQCGRSLFSMIKFNALLDTIWHKRYDNLLPSNCDDVRQLGIFGSTALPDNSFMSVGLAVYGTFQIPDSTAIAYIHFDQDGNVLNYLETHMTGADDPPLYWFDGMRYLGENELLQWGMARPLLPGKLYDYQEEILVMKTDLEGNIIDSLHFGNPNYNEQGATLELLPDNKAIMFYQYTIYDSGFPQWIRETEPRAALIDLSDLSVIWEHTLDTPLFTDIDAVGAKYNDALVTSDNKYVATFSTGLQGENFGGIMKLNDQGILEWCNLYYPMGGEFWDSWLDAIIEASDGGYVATGQTQSSNSDQKQWIIKIDACGYEQPSGCPPVVGVGEQQPQPTMQLWPNPFTSTLKAVLPQNAIRFFICDATGRIVLEEKVFYPNQTWNLSWLSDGVYVMSVQLENGITMSERIVKQ